MPGWYCQHCNQLSAVYKTHTLTPSLVKWMRRMRKSWDSLQAHLRNFKRLIRSRTPFLLFLLKDISNVPYTSSAYAQNAHYWPRLIIIIAINRYWLLLYRYALFPHFPDNIYWLLERFQLTLLYMSLLYRWYSTHRPLLHRCRSFVAQLLLPPLLSSPQYSLCSSLGTNLGVHYSVHVLRNSHNFAWMNFVPCD